MKKRKKIWDALQEGKPIPTELKEDELDLRHDMELENSEISTPSNHIDEEYARAGMQDPKVFITTSRDPSSRLLQFAKELKLVFPNSQRINRGHHIIKELVDACRSNEVTDIIIVHEHRGEPDGLIISHLPYGPTAYFGLMNCVLRHDIKETETASEAYPHLIFHNFNTKLGERTQNILKYLFPVPKEDSKRVITFANQSDFVSFRYYINIRVK